MVGIDWSAPLELMDGTPVSAELDRDGVYFVKRIDGKVFEYAQVGPNVVGSLYFSASASGRHWLDYENGTVLIRNSSEADADKRLRDAAPDLLALAEMMRDESDYRHHRDAARAAIAKATGQ